MSWANISTIHVALSLHLSSKIQLFYHCILRMYQYHTWLLIGRFQPPHRGHGDMISQYLHSRCQHHIIGIGSPYCHPSMTNPFDYETKENDASDSHRRHPLRKYHYDMSRRWLWKRYTVDWNDHANNLPWYDFSGNPRVHQCAAHMSIVCISPEVRIDISATQIRNARYENRLSDVSDNLHPYIYKHLINHSPWSLWLWQDVVLNISDEFV